MLVGLGHERANQGGHLEKLPRNEIASGRQKKAKQPTGSREKHEEFNEGLSPLTFRQPARFDCAPRGMAIYALLSSMSTIIQCKSTTFLNRCDVNKQSPCRCSADASTTR
jgi:hypothetical protein